MKTPCRTRALCWKCPTSRSVGRSVGLVQGRCHWECEARVLYARFRGKAAGLFGEMRILALTSGFVLSALLMRRSQCSPASSNASASEPLSTQAAVPILPEISTPPDLNSLRSRRKQTDTRLRTSAEFSGADRAWRLHLRLRKSSRCELVDIVGSRGRPTQVFRNASRGLAGAEESSPSLEAPGSWNSWECLRSEYPAQR